MAGVDDRRDLGEVAARRQGVVLHRAGWQADGRADRGQRHDAQRRRTGGALSDTDRGGWHEHRPRQAIRRRVRRPLPDQRRHRRGDRLADHSDPQLGGWGEAMSLTTGTRLGPYEILSALGVGGMGEVYRARDTKLGRDVALKVIPDTYALDSDRLARFQREAQVLASLNHPHIAAIYGVEDSGETHALVLE